MEKRFKHGLSIGKFMPIHKGHIHMIEEGAKQCEIMHVLVCTRDVEPINGLLRYKWASEIFKDRLDVQVHWCIEDLPQYPEDDPNFWEIWHEATYRHVPHIDAVFASEEYVYPYAKCLGVEPVLVDLDRTTVPVSGTAIRENPFDNWKFIPDVVKPYYKKSIAIVGPESTGKSTLAKKLANYYLCDYVSEYGREYTDSHPTHGLTSEDFTNIAKTHWQHVVTKQRDPFGRFLFLDTEAIVTRTFGIMYLGDHLDSYTQFVLDTMIAHQVKHIEHYLLLKPDIEWEDDGTRDFGKESERLTHYNMIKEYLDTHEVPYSIIEGEGEIRTQNAILAIEKNVVKSPQKA